MGDQFHQLSRHLLLLSKKPDVISIYSDAYTNVTNDGFNLYGAAAFEEVQIQGDGALKYSLVGTDGGNFRSLN